MATTGTRCTCCHVCHTSLKTSKRDFAPCSTCLNIVCRQCTDFMNEDWDVIFNNPSWSCPRCCGNCPCKRCRNKVSGSPTLCPLTPGSVSPFPRDFSALPPQRAFYPDATSPTSSSSSASPSLRNSSESIGNLSFLAEKRVVSPPPSAAPSTVTVPALPFLASQRELRATATQSLDSLDDGSRKRPKAGRPASQLYQRSAIPKSEIRDAIELLNQQQQLQGEPFSVLSKRKRSADNIDFGTSFQSQQHHALKRRRLSLQEDADPLYLQNGSGSSVVSSSSDEDNGPEDAFQAISVGNWKNPQFLPEEVKLLKELSRKNVVFLDYIKRTENLLSIMKEEQSKLGSQLHEICSRVHVRETSPTRPLDAPSPPFERELVQQQQVRSASVGDISVNSQSIMFVVNSPSSSSSSSSSSQSPLPLSAVSFNEFSSPLPKPDALSLAHPSSSTSTSASGVSFCNLPSNNTACEMHC